MDSVLFKVSIDNEDNLSTIIAARIAINTNCFRREDEQEARRYRFPFRVMGVATDESIEIMSSVSKDEW
jgi:hydrogenase maturation factor HypF (carbamoyltransferase family)